MTILFNVLFTSCKVIAEQKVKDLQDELDKLKQA